MIDVVLETRQLTHDYGGVRALRDVSLMLERSTITCLMGDNGAGKSTLVRILAGALQPTGGALLLADVPVRFENPRAARARGVITVFQDLALAPLLSVWRNFVLGAEPQSGRLFRWLDAAAARSAARDALHRFGLAIDVERPVNRLSGGERQTVAIARAVHFGARVLILDEPTAALAVAQVQRVLAAIVAASDAGAAVLFVTHNPQHALAVADRLIVLRQGQIAAQPDPRGIDAAELTRLITGPTIAASF